MGIPLQCEMCHISNIEEWNLIQRVERLFILTRRENLEACWGKEPSTLRKHGIFDKNQKRCVIRKNVCIPPASVGPVSSGIFGGNETSSYGVTTITKTREIQGLFTVGNCEEILSSTWEYLEFWSTWTSVGYYGKSINKDGDKPPPHQRHMVLEFRERKQEANGNHYSK